MTYSDMKKNTDVLKSNCNLGVVGLVFREMKINTQVALTQSTLFSTPHLFICSILDPILKPVLCILLTRYNGNFKIVGIMGKSKE